MEDPYYHPEPIDKLDPTITGIKTLEKYMDKFDKEIGELIELQQKGTAKEYTAAKMKRRNDLEEKLVEFEMEREVWLANRERALGGSKREGGQEVSKNPNRSSSVGTSLK